MRADRDEGRCGVGRGEWREESRPAALRLLESRDGSDLERSRSGGRTLYFVQGDEKKEHTPTSVHLAAAPTALARALRHVDVYACQEGAIERG